VDARRCEVDRDSDGVPTGSIDARTRPKGATVDSQGCPHDADSDSVYDGIDQCPATPTGCVVNSNGCPVDSDQDGVCDGLDQCPDSPVAAKVDRNGCPIIVSDKETQLLETGMIRLQNINFDTGRLDHPPRIGADPGRGGKYPRAVARAQDRDRRPHRLSGLGRERTPNSARRAPRAVLDYLLSKFRELNPGQFSTAGYGATRPIAPNKTELGAPRTDAWSQGLEQGGAPAREDATAASSARGVALSR